MIFTKLITLLDGKLKRVKNSDVLLLKRNNFTSDEIIEIPQGETLILNCPVIDGDLIIDGEEYIL